MNRASTARRGRDMEALKKKPTPRDSVPLSVGVSNVESFTLRSKRFELHISNPNPQILHMRDKLQKYLALKANRKYI